MCEFISINCRLEGIQPIDLTNFCQFYKVSVEVSQEIVGECTIFTCRFTVIYHTCNTFCLDKVPKSVTGILLCM